MPTTPYTPPAAPYTPTQPLPYNPIPAKLDGNLINALTPGKPGQDVCQGRADCVMVDGSPRRIKGVNAVKRTWDYKYIGTQKQKICDNV